MFSLITGIILLAIGGVGVTFGGYKVNLVFKNKYKHKYNRKPFIWFFILAASGVFIWLGGSIASNGLDTIKSNSKIANNNKIDKPINFNASIFNVLPFKFPSPLIYVHNTKLGKTISPIGLALYIEVSNNKNIVSRITEYELKGLFRYDEDGKLILSEDSKGNKSFYYRPSGNTTEKWLPIRSMGLVQNNVYWVTDNDWKKCARIDFSKNNFDTLARKKQMQPGESILGWILIVSPPELKGQQPKLLNVEIKLKNSHGETTLINIEPPEDSYSILSVGDLNFIGGYYDLSSYVLETHISFEDVIPIKRKSN